MAQKDLHRVANARKAISGQYQGLLDPDIIRRKTDDELSLLAAVKLRGDAAKHKTFQDALTRIEEAEKTFASF